MPPVHWGILGNARIARLKVIPALQRSSHCNVVALASRDLEGALSVAQTLGISQVLGSYEALLEAPEIEAVYIPLPNHLHVPWSIAALRAGKHVLCEKPIALSVAEAETLEAEVRLHPELKLMEAFMYRFHPQWRLAKNLVDDGTLGEVRTVHSFFSYYNDDPTNIRNQAEIGGGALMDIGCYCVSLARFLFDAEPERVTARVDRDPEFQTDRLTSGMLDFGSTSATFTCSTQLASYQRVQIFGTQGRLEIEIPFNAPPNEPCRMFLEKEGKIEEITLEICDQYTLQGELFSQAIREDLPVPTPLSDAIVNMRVIEALFASAESGWKAL